ncbi:MAG: TIGR00730 family Rossman fold protein [Ignavibacteria bacterium]|nr:TIGR00730 family Rossman fold protein [Ignavibacteria bacterium]
MLKKAPKAYSDEKFLKSPAARSLRIVAEYMEPQYRFRKENVRDTIVFYGSARILPRAEAKKRLKALTQHKNPSMQRVIDAEVDLEMSRYYEDTAKLSKMLTEWSIKQEPGNRFVVCSGGGPGIMEASNRGAKKAGGKSIGLNISLPFEQNPNQYITPSLNFEFHYFFMRKFWFAYLAKALIIMPGGFGTLDELFELLTLIQTKKIRKKMPIVIYDRKFWNNIINLEELANKRLIDREDLKLFTVVDTVEEAFEFLKNELMKHYLQKPDSLFNQKASVTPKEKRKLKKRIKES